MVFEFSMGIWQYGHMKTTIEIPEATFRQAKTLAAAQGITFKQLVTEALQRRLKRAVEAAGGVSDAPSWMAGYGALSDLTDENRRILGLIEEEFEKLHPEDLQ